jgi:putative DNA primase/helicase
VDLEVRCAWALTANNPRISGELARRAVWIHLKPQREDPSQRKGFRHANIEAWTRLNRERLQGAFLTILQAWVAQGQRRSAHRLGSYESWAEVIGGALTCAGLGAHFLSNREEMSAYLDAETDDLKAFVIAWWQEHRSAPAAASDLHQLACDQELLADDLGSGNAASQKIRLGKLLGGRLNGRIFDLGGGVVVEVGRAGGQTNKKSGLYKLTPQGPQ